MAVGRAEARHRLEGWGGCHVKIQDLAWEIECWSAFVAFGVGLGSKEEAGLQVQSRGQALRLPAQGAIAGYSIGL